MQNINKIGSVNIQNNDPGYTIINKEYIEINTTKIKQLIADSSYVKRYLNTPFHSILCLFKILPKIKKFVLPNIISMINDLGPNYRCICSTYYDKPPNSKWKLGFHQDIQINLKDKLDDQRFKFWVKRNGYFQVQPPIEVLENIITFRIHLDDCNIENGALKIVPKSHKMGFIDITDYKIENTEIIEMHAGDILKLSPLLLHASGYNNTSEKRGVIHLEFSNFNLPWYEEFFLI